ncbi:MAG: hypothetical protein R3182_08955, partial [Draconibacterium sp.]|nr:hypothetical protein [Draconibacterium sp.]
EMGDWLKKYGESIYEAKGGPYKPSQKMASTRKDKSIYIHLFNREKSSVEIPFPGDIIIQNCSVFKGENLKFHNENGKLKIDIPKNELNQSVLTICLKLNKEADEIATIESPY